MDDAARRVKPSALRALLRTRQERERQALAEVGARLSALAEAERGRARAGAALAEAEAARARGEAAIYAALSEGVGMSPAELEGRRAALLRLTEGVLAREKEVASAVKAVKTAAAAVAESRRAYADRMRDTRKWTQIDDRAATARRRHAADAEELETEDETSLRFRGGVAP